MISHQALPFIKLLVVIVGRRLSGRVSSGLADWQIGGLHGCFASFRKFLPKTHTIITMGRTSAEKGSACLGSGSPGMGIDSGDPRSLCKEALPNKKRPGRISLGCLSRDCALKPFTVGMVCHAIFHDLQSSGVCTEHSTPK